MKTILRFLRDERGTETAEWAIVGGLILVAAVAAITTVGTQVNRVFNEVGNDLSKVQ
jgi:pilus assembly protein Flp/PilA